MARYITAVTYHFVQNYMLF